MPSAGYPEILSANRGAVGAGFLLVSSDWICGRFPAVSADPGRFMSSLQYLALFVGTTCFVQLLGRAQCWSRDTAGEPHWRMPC